MTNHEKVEEIIESIRPFIKNDGGDVEFIAINDEGYVELRLLGACANCGLSDVTVYDNIQKSILEEIPELKGVKVIK